MNDMAKEINLDEIEEVVGGGSQVNQYSIKPGKIYTIYFPMQHGPFNTRPYGDLSGETKNVVIIKVYEKRAIFGTNRTIDGYILETGEKVTVRVNCKNVYEYDGSQVM